MKKSMLMIVWLLLVLMTLSRLDGAMLLYSMNQIPWWVILFLFALQMVTQLLLNWQWYIVAKTAHLSITFWEMFHANCQGAVMDAVTPGVKLGGEVTRAMQISRTTSCSATQSATVVALQKVFSIGVLSLILLFSSGYLIGEVSWLSPIYIQVLIFSMLTLFLTLFLGIFFFPQPLKGWVQGVNLRFLWLNRVQNFLVVLLELVNDIRQKKKTCMMLICLSFWIWLLYPIKMYVLVQQFQSEIGVIHLVAITFVAYLVAMLPIFPGGLGGFEGTMSGLLVATGFLVSDAAIITVFFRFITFWLVMLFSFCFVAFHRIIDGRHILKLKGERVRNK